MDITLLTNAEYRDLPEPRPHRFPEREPSDSCYAQGCRCPACRDLHAAATRNRQRAQRAGLWVDGRRAIRVSGFLSEVVELAERVPELHALLMKYGHAPMVLRIRPDLVVNEQHRPVAPEPAQGAQTVVSEPAALPAGSSADPQDAEPVNDDRRPADEQPESGALSAEAEKVLRYLQVSRAHTRGKLSMIVLSTLPTVLRIAPDRCQAILNELENAGWLAGDGRDILLIDPDTATAPAPAPKTTAPSTPTATYVEGKGVQWVRT